MKALIIVPTYNESGNLETFIAEVFHSMPNAHLLIIDDNSPDGTGQIADAIHQRMPQVTVIHRPHKMGLGSAYILGFRYAITNGYDYVFEMDADFSHDPRDLPRFLSTIEQSPPADLVIGSRYIAGGSTPNWSALRRFVSGGGNLYARLLLGIPIHDCTAGYRCYRTSSLAHLYIDKIKSNGYSFQIEMAYAMWKSGFSIREFPVTFVDRRVGQSKMSRTIFFEAFRWVLTTRIQGSPVVNRNPKQNNSFAEADRAKTELEQFLIGETNPHISRMSSGQGE
jgi:dolichol-phosphate mannosyltransferase